MNNYKYNPVYSYNIMVRIQHVSKGAETVEVMNNLAYYLLTTGLAKEENLMN